MTTARSGDISSWPPPASCLRVSLPSPSVADQCTADAIDVRVSTASSLFVLLPLRIFLAAGWARAAAEKVISSGWWNGDELRRFVVEQNGPALPFFRPVLEHAISPAAAFVAVAVVLGEIACAVALATGRFMRLALYLGVVMNVAFVFAGRVNPSAFYLVMEIALLFAIAEGAIGCAARRPTNRTRSAAGVWFLLALAFVPFIRTMAPAHVIADPAAMCLFLAMIIGVGLLYRWATDLPSVPASRVATVLIDRADAWAHAKHTPLNRRRHATSIEPGGNSRSASSVAPASID